VIVLETPRLRLREMVPDDLAFVAAMLGHPEVARYYERLFTHADAQGWLERERPEIGWLLHRPFWGHGYATEAAAATRDAAFTRWRYPEVISLIRPVNEPSQRVARRLGMAPQRNVPFHGFEHVVFAVSA